MASLNKVSLLGTLGKNPELYRFSSGASKVSFSVATNDSFTNKEGLKVEVTDWHNVAVFGKIAEEAEKYLRKGSNVYLEGRFRTRSWEDNGVKKYFSEIEVRDYSGKLVRLHSNSDQPAVITQEGSSNNFNYATDSNSPTTKKDETTLPPADEVDDDLPF